MAEVILADPGKRDDPAWRSTEFGLASSSPGSTFQDALKRVFDITAVTAGLIFLLPMVLAISALVYLQDGGPVLFAQERLGRNGRIFRCLKFRTMVVDSQARLDALLATDPAARAEWGRDHKLRNDPRITPLGSFLRKSSLDEIPQLLNILIGDMSIVGPRPIVLGEIQRYGARFSHYCNVKPGLTGLWQVSGRNNTSYRRRVAMDTIYAAKHSFAMDLWIIVRTVPAVLFSRGSF